MVEGLVLALNRNLLPLAIELNPLSVVTSVNSNTVAESALAEVLVDDCRRILKELGGPRLTNGIADF